MTRNDASIRFSMENAQEELPAMSSRIRAVTCKRYLEGYPVPGVRYSWLTRQYIRAKRDKFFVVRAEFAEEVTN